MNKKMLDILVDPDSRLPLTLEDPEWEDDDIIKGKLRSRSDKIYPIINGIPRFVEPNNYAGSFGMQWNRFARTQFDSRTGCNYSRMRFENETMLDKEWSENKLILDAGCGAGRFSEIAAGLKCRLVALDMSSAVDAARANLSEFTNVEFVQASIYNLPFRPGTFDAFYSIGVLQHTPCPYEALGCLLDAIRKGGKFAVTIYGMTIWTKLYSKYLLRRLLSRMDISNENLLYYIEKMMPVMFQVTNSLFSIPLLKKVFRFIIPIANYVERKDMSRAQRYEEAVLDTFDMLSPKYDNPAAVPRVIKTLKESRVSYYEVLSKRPVNIVGGK